jgi:hypothetical protein
MSFLGSLAAEFVARRMRLHAWAGTRGAAPLEFALIGGLILGAAAVAVKDDALDVAPWAPAPLLLAPILYLVLDFRRQSALAQGVAPEIVQARYDRLIFILLVVLALAGFAGFLWGVLAPAQAPESPILPSGRAFDATIGP